MRELMISALALGALLVPGIAAADDVTDRTQAIQLCRAEIAAQAGLNADTVRLDQVRVRPRLVRADFDIWRDGRLTNVRCDVQRAQGELTIASVSPSLGALASAR